MKIRIYQINLDRDEKVVGFQNLETVLASGDGIIPAEIYDMVYECEAETANLEELFYIFNMDHPYDFVGRSMSMSDIVELIDPEEGSTFHFCDTFGFKEVDFDASQTQRGPGNG